MQKQVHKLVVVLLLLPTLLLAQTQIGSDIYGGAEYDALGRSVSLSSDGNIMAIGAPQNGGDGFSSPDPTDGYVRIYEKEDGTWTQIGSDIDGEAIGDAFGGSVSLSSDGSIVAIGATANDGMNGNLSGHVRIYKNVEGTWTQVGEDIDGEAASDQSGRSVSLSGDGSIVAIGASSNDGTASDSGHVRVYKNVDGTWTQLGSDIDGEAGDDFSGYSVSISNDGSIVAIGAILNDGDVDGDNYGHVRVYQFVSGTGTWNQVGSDINGENANDFSGWSVSLSSDGSIVAIGSTRNFGENGGNSGHVRVYKNNNGFWNQLGSDIDGEAQNDQSGISVSLSSNGSIVAIGASTNSGGATQSGHVRVYQFVETTETWTQIGTDIDGDVQFDSLGSSVSLSADGHSVAIGAPNHSGNDGDISYSGQVRVYDLSQVVLNVDRQLLETITIYPNPTSDYVNLALPSSLELEKVVIYNSLGQLVSAQKEAQVNLSNYAQGVYYIELITTQGKIVKQFIKE